MNQLMEMPQKNNAPAPTDQTASSLMADVEVARAVQEVQAKMLVAKNFPRNEEVCRSRVLRECQRQRLAEQAMYSYPRGGQQVTGPSIRLAEVLMRYYGNMDAGFESRQVSKMETEVRCFARDYESNTEFRRTFIVRHERYTRKGTTKLTDPRDIYEMVANMAQRRVRAVILEIIPGYIVDEAVEACEKTLAGGAGRPIEDLRTSMLAKFADIAVTKEMIEARVGHNFEAINQQELVALGKIYTSLRDGYTKREDYFELPKTEDKSKSGAAERLNAKASKKSEGNIKK